MSEPTLVISYYFNKPYHQYNVSSPGMKKTNMESTLWLKYKNM